MKPQVGQRWRFFDEFSDDISEVVEVISNDECRCKILQVKKGSNGIGNIERWYINTSGWEYLPGQDK